MSRRLFGRSLAILILLLVLAGWVGIGAELAIGGTRVLSVSGTIRSAETGRTVRGAEVTLAFEGRAMRRAATDGGGHYELSIEMPDGGPLPVGQYQVTAADRRYCGATEAAFILRGTERTETARHDLTLTDCAS